MMVSGVLALSRAFGWGAYLVRVLFLRALCPLGLLTAHLVTQPLLDQDDGYAPGPELSVYDQDLVDGAAHAVCRLGTCVLQRVAVLVYTPEPLFQVRNYLLGPDHPGD